jgi:hypothetical protein
VLQDVRLAVAYRLLLLSSRIDPERALNGDNDSVVADAELVDVVRLVAGHVG